MSRKTTVNLLEKGDVCEVNCRISGTQLLPALAPARLEGYVPSQITCAYHAEGAGKFFLCTKGQAFISSDGASFSSLLNLTGSPTFWVEDICGGIARATLIDGGNAVACTDGTQRIAGFDAKLGCGVMHCGRLFGADADDGLKIVWSGEGGLDDWEQKINGGGSLTLDPELGNVLDIVEYGEKLVAVRKFGLSVLNAFGAPENFSVELNGADSCEIFKGTAKSVRGKLLFFTSAGLRRFDGVTVSAVEHAYANDISKPACAVAFDGKYFLGCTSKSLNGGAVLCYDAEEGASMLIGVKADGMCCADAVYVYNSLGAYRLEEGGKFTFTKKFDFNSDKKKTVVKMFVGGIADVEISNGRVARKFLNACGTIRPHMRGKSFTVKVTGTGAVNGLTATAEECDGI